MIGLALSANLTSLTPSQIATIHRLEDRLMAPCCYPQTIREHQSEVAKQMREEVTEMVSEGKSEKEIILRNFKLERRAGIEPANTGFADLRVKPLRHRRM